jgi:hypothetical protein
MEAVNVVDVVVLELEASIHPFGGERPSVDGSLLNCTV